MLCATMLLATSETSFRHVEELPWQAGTPEMSHWGPEDGWQPGRGEPGPSSAPMGQGGAVPHAIDTLRQTCFILPAGASPTWRPGVLGVPGERAKLETPGKGLQEKQNPQ